MARAYDKFSKPVLMLSNDGDIIMKFKSLHSAVDYLIENNVIKAIRKPSGHHITQACRGDRKTAYGYKWAYAS